MSTVTDLLHRFRSLLARQHESRELDEELRLHLDLETEKNIREGMTPTEARRRARLSFGGVERIREEASDARGVRALEDLARDLRHSVRTLRRRPAFTLVAVATLAIGIGASTAMFTLVNSVLLEPLAYHEPEQLVAVGERPPDRVEGVAASPLSLAAWRGQSQAVESFAAFTDRPLTLVDHADPAEVRGRYATGEYFRVLGVPAHLGRTLLPEDDGERQAVLGHALWQTRYGGDPGVIGRSISLDGDRFTVVGVMPRDFRSVAGQPELWVSMPELDPEWPGRYLEVIGRLRRGATAQAARSELETVVSRLAAERPQSHRGWGIVVTPLQEEVTGHARPALLVLLGAVTLLLLIACANVANLFLGRAAGRRQEMAVRRSLGASRGRLIVHTMSEAVVVAVLAGMIGVGLALVGTDAIVRLLPADLALPRMDEVALDHRVLAFALGVSLLTGLLFGAGPALGGSSVQLGGALREATRGSTGSRSRLRGALVVGEVALALVLLASAGLLVRTVHNLLRVDPGLTAENVLTVRMALASARYDSLAERRAFANALLPRLAALPGASTAGGISALPLGGSRSVNFFLRDDRPRPEAGEEPEADIRVVSGDYFAALGVPLLRGRTFDAGDDERAPPRFIVNEALAQLHFPGEDAVGKQITVEWFGEFSGEIVGVVGSVRESSLDAEPSPALYRPYAQDPRRLMTIVVRTQGAPTALAPAAASVIRELDPQLPPGTVRSMEQVVTDTLSRQRLSMFLLAGFAGISLVLVVIGLYGVISYAVAQRTREIGVRIALGAQRGDVLRMIVGQGMMLTALGLTIGVAGALAVSRLLGGMLYGVAPTDLPTISAAALLLAATALLGAYIPAHRATRIDPAGVLAES